MAEEEKPPERPTARLDQTEILKGLVNKLSDAMTSGLARLETKIDDGFSDVTKRVIRLEAWKEDVDTRMTKNSERVRGQSETDLQHEAKIATEILEREALTKRVDAIDAKQDKQLAILDRLDHIAKNPVVKEVVKVLATAILTWAAMKGFL